MQISVIIPAFNRERVLSATIDSVHAQSHPPHEIIVVDDGSTDGTADLAERRNCKVIRQPNQGLSAARNTGARHASGDVFFFLDSDDLLVPEALEKCLRAMVSSNSDVVIPNYLIMNGTTSYSFLSRTTGSRRLGRSDLRYLLQYNFLGANAMMRRSAWEDHPYDELLRSAEDLAIWLELLADGYILQLLYEHLVLVRVGDSIDRLSKNIGMMRRSRLRVYTGWLTRSELHFAERATVIWKILASWTGIILADLETRTDWLGRRATGLDSVLVAIAERYQRNAKERRNAMEN